MHSPTDKEVDDLLVVRTTLESQSARLAARARTDGGIGRLWQLWDAGTRAVQAGDPEAIVDANADFHSCDMAIGDNRVLAELGQLVDRRVRWHYRPVAQGGNSPDQVGMLVPGMLAAGTAGATIAGQDRSSPSSPVPSTGPGRPRSPVTLPHECGHDGGSSYDRGALRAGTCTRWAAGLLAGGIAASELWHWRASRSGSGPGVARGSRAVVVLGYPSRRHGRLHPMQKWRTQIALRSLPPAPEDVLVFTGGRSRGAEVPEAEAMAAYARWLGLPGHRILLETEATNTRENLRLALPLTDSFDTVVIVSDPLHAARARRYALALRPDLAGRLAFADDYRFLERWWLKAPVAAYELAALVRDRAAPHG